MDVADLFSQTHCLIDGEMGSDVGDRADGQRGCSWLPQTAHASPYSPGYYSTDWDSCLMQPRCC